MTEDSVVVLLLNILILVGLSLGMFGLNVWVDKKTCEQRFASFERKFGIFSGCLIKINDKWIPDESYYLKEDIKK